jgi:F0F1-type ATP synthase assembly protein I
MKDEYKAVGSWSTLGMEIVLSVLVGYFGGRWLDGRFGTAPWLSLLGFFFGCGAAGKAVHRTWKEMTAVTAREEREQGNPPPLYETPEKREEGSPEGSSSPMSPEDHDEHAH